MPGLGVLRDGQKWVALAMPGYAVAGAAAVVDAAAGVRPRRHGGGVLRGAGRGAARPGVGRRRQGRRRCSTRRAGRRWPRSINADPRPVAVLPADSMRQLRVGRDAPVLDPLPRWVRADVLTHR